MATEDAQRTLWWLYGIQLVSMGALEMSGPFWPVYLRSLGDLSPRMTGIVGGAAYAGPMLAAMLTTPLWGRLGDRYGHKPMLLRALFALAATQLWVVFAGSVTSVLCARLVQGGFAGFIAAAQAYGAGMSTAKRRTLLIAQLQTATAIGSFAGPMLGGWLYAGYGFESVNLVATGLCLSCAIAALVCLPQQRKHFSARESQIKKPPEHHVSPLWLGLLLAIVLIQAGKMMPQIFFALYVDSVLVAPAWVTGLCYGITALGLTFSAPLWARYFDKLPDARALRTVEFVTWLCVATLVLQALASNLTVFILVRFLWGIWLGGLLPVFYALLSRASGDNIQGYIMGLANSASKAGGLLGFGCGTVAIAWFGLTQGFWFVALTYLVAALGIRVLRCYFLPTSQTTCADMLR
ncbi:MFS transporter [Glaciimonas immobilis]|uniref:MFS family permease n=1 Tax=Glaciimonas immobilis TaxID=728004 RepID=A0A840RXY5_9BURK|nr:MFS transporter [Glaciimonas immobilis]KAF3996764.1 multidrug efflux MFS transporter [Glaciimonas immobilis]MBB5201310.1 MFS family permease [Glaciimonas immobilis]